MAGLVARRLRAAAASLRVAALAISLLAGAVAAQPARELLNSERIAEAFGSYGIEVLDNGPTERVSRLFSMHDGVEICRTFAVVMYPESLAPALASEHGTIVDGGSIGATFAAAGWEVRKAHRYFGELPSTPGLSALMHIPDDEVLAVHVYTLSVAREGREHEYATIAEIHHPGYLGLEDLHTIYGAGMTLPTRSGFDIERALERVVARLP